MAKTPAKTREIKEPKDRKAPPKSTAKANLLTGLFMLVAGAAFTITGIGAIIGIPLFLVGLVFTGFFLMKLRRDSRAKDSF